jgi:hypothetical protein
MTKYDINTRLRGHIACLNYESDKRNENKKYLIWQLIECGEKRRERAKDGSSFELRIPGEVTQGEQI